MMKMKNYPVVVFVYNRPQKARRVLDSIANAILAKSTEVYVFSDGPKNDQQIENVKAVRQIVKDEKYVKSFNKYHVIEASINKGLATSIIEGVSEIITKSGAVIVVEDDNIVSTDFLVYMNTCLEKYKDNHDVGSISGMSLLKSNDLLCCDYDVYALERVCSFAWGTWKDRWELVDWSVSDYKQFKNNNKERARFLKTGNDHVYLLTAQMNSIVNSWAIRFDYSMFKHKMLTIYPTVSKVKNMGYDGSGTHYNKKMKQTKWQKNVAEINLERDAVLEYNLPNQIMVNDSVQKTFKSYVSIPTYRLILKYVKLYFKKLKSRRV